MFAISSHHHLFQCLNHMDHLDYGRIIVCSPGREEDGYHYVARPWQQTTDKSTKNLNLGLLWV